MEFTSRYTSALRKAANALDGAGKRLDEVLDVALDGLTDVRNTAASTLRTAADDAERLGFLGDGTPTEAAARGRQYGELTRENVQAFFKVVKDTVENLTEVVTDETPVDNGTPLTPEEEDIWKKVTDTVNEDRKTYEDYLVTKGYPRWLVENASTEALKSSYEAYKRSGQ